MPQASSLSKSESRDGGTSPTACNPLDDYLALCKDACDGEIDRLYGPGERGSNGLYDLILDYPLRGGKTLRPALSIARSRHEASRFENRDVLPRFYPARVVVLEFKGDYFAKRLVAENDWAHTGIVKTLPVESDRMRQDLLAPRPTNAPDAKLTITQITAALKRARRRGRTLCMDAACPQLLHGLLLYPIFEAADRIHSAFKFGASYDGISSSGSSVPPTAC